MKAAEWMWRCPLAHGIPVKPTQSSVLLLRSQPGCPFQHTHTHPFAQLCFSIFHSFHALSIAVIICCADILYNVKIRCKEGRCGVCVSEGLRFCYIHWNVSPEYLGFSSHCRLKWPKSDYLPKCDPYLIFLWQSEQHKSDFFKSGLGHFHMWS